MNYLLNKTKVSVNAENKSGNLKVYLQLLRFSSLFCVAVGIGKLESNYIYEYMVDSLQFVSSLD